MARGWDFSRSHRLRLEIAFDTSVGPVPSSLLVTLNTALAGQPSWDGQAIGLPAEMDGTGPSGVGTGQAVLAGFNTLFSSAGDPNDNALAMTHSPTKEVDGEGEPIDPTPSAVRVQADAETASARADILAVAQTEWVMRIGSFVQDWFTAPRSDAPRQAALTRAVPPPEAFAHQPAQFVKDPASPWRNRHLISALRSELGATASLIMIGAVAYRLRHPIRGWWRERAQIVGHGKVHCGRALPGPHPVARLSRITTHVRKNH